MQRFSDIWLRQYQLQKQYAKAMGWKQPGVDADHDAEKVLGLLRALGEEVHEAMCTLPYRKTWKACEPPSVELDKNMAKFRTELADILLFTLAVAQWAGLDADELLRSAHNKQEVNKTRADHLLTKGANRC